MFKKLRNILLSYITIIFYLIFKKMPWRVNVIVGRILSKIFYIFDFRYKYIAFRNLKLVFPDYSWKKVIFITKKCYENLGINLMEFFQLNRVRYFYKKIVEFSQEDKNLLKELIKSGKSVVIFSAHFSNWELLGCSLAIEKFPLAVIARQMYISTLGLLVDRIRSSVGEIVINRSTHSSMKNLLYAIKNKYLIGVLVDQNIKGINTIKVPFLGIESNTPISFIETAIKYDLPSVVGLIYRNKNYRYTIKIFPIDKTYYNDKMKFALFVN
ncbi:MAG: lysophospholipid acyltransferase family protein, partial [Endomicrobia bacterium]|nr:lysophospholipid acyltransferase family protein [Endomicrobiia bacterium]